MGSIILELSSSAAGLTLIRSIKIHIIRIFLRKSNQTTVKKATNAKSNELQPRYGMTPVTNMTEVKSFPPDILTDMSIQDYY